jgi:Domain of unknown function DUF29
MMTIFSPIATPAPLYEQDYHPWLENTAQQLRDGNLAALDIQNLLEEIAAMGRSERRSVYSDLKILLLHLLNYADQPSMQSNRWLGSVVEYRQQINRAFKDSPSLRPYYAEIFVEAYGEARELAAVETVMAIDDFPMESPFGLDAVLRSAYLPDF